jgi:hypothetical protein
VKLYNAGSFFDPGAIPREDDAEIARHVAVHERVHRRIPSAFLAGAHGERCLAFRDRLSGALEVAIGLETAHPDVLARLNKRMSLAGFRRAADFPGGRGHRAARVPAPQSAVPAAAAEGEWACRSIDVAAATGAPRVHRDSHARGNGAMEALAGPVRSLRASRPSSRGGVRTLARRPVVLADLWDIERFVRCACDRARVSRLPR